jgi:hypothetical protein
VNTLLAKHIDIEAGKSRQQSIEAYEQAWKASKYLLTPLAKMLAERKSAISRVDEKDFETPNHYGKIMFNKGKEEELDWLLSLLPKDLAE